MKLPPFIQAGPSSTQTYLSIASPSSALMLAVPSFIPKRLRGVVSSRLVVEVRPKPSWDQRMVTVPRPIRARLRIAWKTTWGSSAQAWTQMSPPDSSPFSSSPGGGGGGRGGAAGGTAPRRRGPRCVRRGGGGGGAAAPRGAGRRGRAQDGRRSP